jgi:hypothetical protein
MARLWDNGPEAQVILHLKQVNLYTGQQTTLLTLDSNNFPVASGFQTVSTGDPNCSGATFEFDFVHNAYYIDATLAKTGPNGTPALAAMQIADARPCPPK